MVPTQNRELTTTSAPSEAALSITTVCRRLCGGGFTLIETLVVLAIISMVMALAMPAIEQVTQQRVYSTCRKFIGVIRTIRNDSILLNSIYRLAVDFDHKVWWVDQQREFKLLELESEGSKKKEMAGGKTDEPAPSNFVIAEKFSRKPAPFPNGVSFDGVLKEREGFRKEGVVFIHFFPNGYNEPAILYINRDGKDITESNSLLIKPTSGTVEFYKKYVKDFNTESP